MMRLVAAAAVFLVSAPAWAQSETSSTSASLGDHRSLLLGFHARIDDLESRISVAEGIVASLKDNALGGSIEKTRAVIRHENSMGDGFELENAIYTLDGGIIFSKENTDGSLDRQKRFELYNGAITPGKHLVEVTLLFRGRTSTVFTYLEGYRFKVSSKYVLEVAEGKTTTLAVVSYEREDITMETEDRIAVRYDVEIGTAPAKKKPDADPPKSE